MILWLWYGHELAGRSRIGPFQYTTGGRQGRGDPDPSVVLQLFLLPTGPPWPQLFMVQESPPLPCLGCSFIAEISDSPRNFTPLCLCSCCSPSQMPSHCPCLATAPSFFKAQLGCHTSHCSLPRAPALVTHSSLHGLLVLHLCLPFAFVTESKLGFASRGQRWTDPVLPALAPPGLGTLWVPHKSLLAE